MTVILDSRGNTITEGARVTNSPDADHGPYPPEVGTVVRLTEPDADHNGYRYVPLGPYVIVRYDDGTEERWTATWNATGPWDDYRDDYTCDDVTVVVPSENWPEPDGYRVGDGGTIHPTSR